MTSYLFCDREPGGRDQEAAHMDSIAAYADSDEEAGPPLQVAAPSSTPIAAAQPVAPAATAPVEGAAQQQAVALQTQVARAQPPAQSLPNDGWVEYKTAQGFSYYYHILSHVTTWERPAAFQAPPHPASNQPPAQAAPTATAPRKPMSWYDALASAHTNAF